MIMIIYKKPEQNYLFELERELKKKKPFLCMARFAAALC